MWSEDIPSGLMSSDTGSAPSETPEKTNTCVLAPAGRLTYGRDEGCVEGVVREAKQHTGLPHTRVTDQKQLEQQVVRLFRH